ncbi:MAG: TolC family protein [Thermodesulfobacteriota bacterium]
MRRLGIFVILISTTLVFFSQSNATDFETNTLDEAEVQREKTESEYSINQEVSAPLESVELRLIAKDSLPIDLLTAIRIASSDNLDIAEARAQVLEAKGNSNAAFGGLIPVVSLFFGYGRTDGRVQGSFGELRDVTFDTLNPGIITSYILNPGESIYNAIAAHRNVDAVISDESAITQDVLLAVVEGYFDLVEAQGNVNVSEKAVSDAQNLVKIAEVLEKQGIGPGADVVRAKTDLASKEQSLINAQEGFREASADLALILKLDSSVTLFPSDTQIKQIRFVENLRMLDDLINGTLKEHPEIRSANKQADAAGAEVSGAWLGAFGPEVLLAAEIGGIGDRFGNIGERGIYQGVIGLTISASSYGEIKASRASLRRAEIRKAQERERLRAGVVKTHDQVLSAGEKIIPAREEQELAEESLKLSQVRFKRGLGLAVEVIQAEDAVAVARLNYIRSIINYNKAQVRLLNAIGEITVEKLVAGME